MDIIALSVRICDNYIKLIENNGHECLAISPVILLLLKVDHVDLQNIDSIVFEFARDFTNRVRNS